MDRFEEFSSFAGWWAGAVPVLLALVAAGVMVVALRLHTTGRLVWKWFGIDFSWGYEHPAPIVADTPRETWSDLCSGDPMSVNRDRRLESGADSPRRSVLPAGA